MHGYNDPGLVWQALVLITATEGPQFSTRAESRMYRSWGGSVINMSVLPEAKLAREAEIAYQMICMSTDYDCWHPSGDVTVEMVMGNMKANAINARRFIGAVLDELSKEEHTALVYAKHLEGQQKFAISTAVPGRSVEALAKLNWLFPERRHLKIFRVLPRLPSRHNADCDASLLKSKKHICRPLALDSSRHHDITTMPPRTSAASGATASSSTSTMPAPPTMTRPVIPLPSYQRPLRPLTPEALNSLASLSKHRAFCVLPERLKAAEVSLSSSAADMNERVVDLTARHKLNRAKRARLSDENDEVDGAEENELNGLRERAERITQRMDKSVRSVIDAFEGVAAMQDCLKHVRQKASTASGGAGATQASTQRTRASANVDTQVTHDIGIGSTDPSSPAPDSLKVVFEESLEQRRDRYQLLPMATRYAGNNTYRQFKHIVHDSSYPSGEAPPLPPSSRWFKTPGSEPMPGTTTTGDNVDDDEDDDDIAIARERISTRCPLTLREYEKPVTSKKCPHSFEEEAFRSLLGQQTRPASQRHGAWKPEVQCPVPGCQQTLTQDDVHTDAAIVRRIQRIQRARDTARENDTDDENREDRSREAGSGRRVEDIDSDSGDDIDAVHSTQVRVKAEARKSQRDAIQDEQDDADG
ncbi:hypothetical protein MRB53_042163 [Persea americana]|nr:hypothetical protein MRB53_042163 [Persea americana]